MSIQVQLRRGTTSGHASFTGAVGEVTVDTDKDTLVVHDGSTAGGFPLARESSVIRSLVFTVGSGGSVPATGVAGYLVVPFSGTIDRWDIVADASGSIVLDVWKRAGAIPTVTHTIAGSEKPTLSSAQIGSDTNLTTWTTSVAAGDVFGINIDSVSTIKQATLTIRIKV